MLSKNQVEAEEESIRSDSLQLPDDERQAFYTQFNGKIKDPDTYATLAWSLPFCLHHFYLGEWVRALLDIAVAWAGLAFCFTGKGGLIAFGVILILGVMMAELYSLVRAQVIVQNHNNRTMRKIITRLEKAH